MKVFVLLILLFIVIWGLFKYDDYKRKYGSKRLTTLMKLNNIITGLTVYKKQHPDFIFSRDAAIGFFASNTYMRLDDSIVASKLTGILSDPEEILNDDYGNKIKIKSLFVNSNEMTTNAVRYTVIGNEAFVIYSAGPNGIDENGSNDDIVLIDK